MPTNRRSKCWSERRKHQVAVGRREFTYIPLLIVSTGLLFAKNLVYAKLLPVASFGSLSQSLLISSTFANFAGAGLQLLGHKVLPRNYARGQFDAVTDLIGSALGVFGLASAVAAAGMGLALVLGLLRSVPWWCATLLCAMAQYAFVLRLIDLKSDLHFIKHAIVSAIRAMSLLACGALVAHLSHNVAAVLGTEGLVTLLLAMPICARGRGREAGRKAVRLWSEHAWLQANISGALRLLWLNSTMTLLYSLDRWSGLLLLSEHEYGILALGLMALVVFDTAQTIINVAAYPLMGRMIARGDRHRAFRLATLATLSIVGMTAVRYMPAIWLLDYLLRHYLTAYVDAAVVIKIAVLAGALRLADFYGSFAILCDRERTLAHLFGLVTLVTAALIILLHRGFGVQFSPTRLVLVTLGVSMSGFVGNAVIAFGANRTQLHERPA